MSNTSILLGTKFTTPPIVDHLSLGVLDPNNKGWRGQNLCELDGCKWLTEVDGVKVDDLP